MVQKKLKMSFSEINEYEKQQREVGRNGTIPYHNITIQLPYQLPYQLPCHTITIPITIL